MSGKWNTIVDLEVGLHEVDAQAARLIKWLHGREIINSKVPDAQPDIFVSENIKVLAFSWGPRRHEALDWHGYKGGQLEIQIGRQLFGAGEGGIQIFCTECDAEQCEHGKHWEEPLMTWIEKKDTDLICANCDHQAPISKWIFDPRWAVGNFGVASRFSFEQQFVYNLRLLFDHETRFILTHI